MPNFAKRFAKNDAGGGLGVANRHGQRVQFGRNLQGHTGLASPCIVRVFR